MSTEYRGVEPTSTWKGCEGGVSRQYRVVRALLFVLVAQEGVALQVLRLGTIRL